MRFAQEIRDGCLHVEIGGPIEPLASRSAIEEIVRTCAAGGLSRVLVDARGLESVVSISERFALGRALAERCPAQVRMAVLVEPAQMVAKTLEDSATNRGVSVRTTASPDEAYRFLGVPPPG
jgi:hypothetical protein